MSQRPVNLTDVKTIREETISAMEAGLEAICKKYDHPQVKKVVNFLAVLSQMRDVSVSAMADALRGGSIEYLMAMPAVEKGYALMARTVFDLAEIGPEIGLPLATEVVALVNSQKEAIQQGVEQSQALAEKLNATLQ